MVEKRKRPVSSVTQKKIKLTDPQNLPEVDNTRKEINKVYSKLLAKDVRDPPKLCKKILDLIGDDLLSASKKHDLCRVLQACLKLGNTSQKTQLYEVLRPSFAELASGKYSYFLAKKLLKVGDKEELLQEIWEKAKTMVKSSYGIKFLDILYSEGNYRSRLLESLLDLKVTEAEGDLNEEIARQIRAAVPSRKILAKGMLEYPLAMHLMYIYLRTCEMQERLELLGEFHNHFEGLMKSRYGAMLAIQALAASDVKQRKLILKAAQPLVPLISQSNSYAYLFFIKLVYVIDDTTRVNKMISLPVIQNMKAFVSSINGAKFLINVSPYSCPSGALSGNELEVLEESLNKTSKKSVEVKKKEVFTELLGRLCREISENFVEIVNNPRVNGLVVVAALGVANGLSAGKELVKAWAEGITNWDVMDHVNGHRVVKRILEAEAEGEKKVFVKAALKALKGKEEYLKKLVKSKGVWVFVAMVEKSGLKNKCKKLLRSAEGTLDQTRTGEKALLDILNRNHRL